jgi:predicted DNA-binding transcriptional regulator AlpA
MGGTERRFQDLDVDEALIDELADRLGEVIVERVVEAINAESTNARVAHEPAVWLDAREAASRLGVTREWVYEHANELGASRIGNGPRPRLRFPAELLARRTHAEQPARVNRRSKPAGLIPIRTA